MSTSAQSIDPFHRCVGMDAGGGLRSRRGAGACVDGDGRRRTEVDPLLGRRHRLHVRASLQTAAPNAPPPAQLNPLHTNLVDNLQRLNVPVDKILPLHGRVVPATELYAAVGQSPPK